MSHVSVLTGEIDAATKMRFFIRFYNAKRVPCERAKLYLSLKWSMMSFLQSFSHALSHDYVLAGEIQQFKYQHTSPLNFYCNNVFQVYPRNFHAGNTCDKIKKRTPKSATK